MPVRRAGGESGGSFGPLAGLGSRGLPGADSGWGWGLGLVAAGAEVQRGRGRALLEQDRLRFPRHRLTHSLAAAQVGGIAPKEVAARTLGRRAPHPLGPIGRRSFGGSEGEPPGLHTCAGARDEHSCAVGSMCADSGHARTCTNGFACVVAGCVSVCWGARASQSRGERDSGTPGSLACRWGAGSIAKPAVGRRLWAAGSMVRGGPGRGKCSGGASTDPSS